MYKHNSLPSDAFRSDEDAGEIPRVRRQVEMHKRSASYGIRLARDGKHIVVAHVQEDSPGWLAGVMVGDRVEQVGSISVRPSHIPVELERVMNNSRQIMLQLAAIEEYVPKATHESQSTSNAHSRESKPLFRSPLLESAQKLVRRLSDHANMSSMDSQADVSSSPRENTLQRRSLAPTSDIPGAFGDQV